MKRYADSNADLSSLPVHNKKFASSRKIHKEKVDTEVQHFKDNYFLELSNMHQYSHSYPRGCYFGMSSYKTTMREAQEILIEDLQLYAINPTTNRFMRLRSWLDWPQWHWSVYGLYPYHRTQRLECEYSRECLQIANETM